MTDIRDRYICTIIFENYKCTFRLRGALSFNPNNPPKEWGQATQIRLGWSLSSNPDSDKTMQIPAGCTPQYHSLVTEELNTGRKTRILRIGFLYPDGARVLTSVDDEGHVVDGIRE